MVHFLNKGEAFMSYQRPPQYIDDPILETDIQKRRELIKRHALCNSIYEEGELPGLPFKHKKEDEDYLRAYEIKYLQKTVMADTIGDIESLGVQLTKEDFEAEIAKDENAKKYIQEDKYL